MSVCAHVRGNKFPRSAGDGRHTSSSRLSVHGRLALDPSWLSHDPWVSHQKGGQEVKLSKPAGQQPLYPLPPNASLQFRSELSSLLSKKSDFLLSPNHCHIMKSKHLHCMCFVYYGKSTLYLSISILDYSTLLQFREIMYFVSLCSIIFIAYFSY